FASVFFALPLVGLGFFFALGVKGLGGVLSILARTASRELSGGFVMATNPDELMLALAYALEKWSRVEMSLSSLFEVLSDIPTQKKAHALFDSIISFEARLDVVTTLTGQEGLSVLDMETWNRCAAKLSKL